MSEPDFAACKEVLLWKAATFCREGIPRTKSVACAVRS